MPIRWLRQKEPNGCVAATLAMLLGVTFSDARNMLGKPREDGCYCTYRAEKILYDHGWALCTVRPRRFDGSDRSWPPRPFAEVHLVSVEVIPDAPTYHSVLWLRDGTVLDPLTNEPRRLENYHSVARVTGLVHMGEIS